MNDDPHARRVDAWAAAVGTASVRHVAAALVAALTSVWQRSRVTLGDVTLGAIFDRVLRSARSVHPVLVRLDLRASDAGVVTLDADAAAEADAEEVMSAARAAIHDLVAILGKLTGEALTPTVHAALEASASAFAPGAPSPPAATHGPKNAAVGTPPPTPRPAAALTPARAPSGGGKELSAMTNGSLQRLATGIEHLDPLLGGGLPLGSTVVLAGPPGSGKTIFAQQIAFHTAKAGQNVLYVSTLSEPASKILLYLRQFTYFAPELLESRVSIVDLGVILRSRGLVDVGPLLMEHVERVRPTLVVIDSFKIFDDFAGSDEALRKFSYEIAVKLMAWECTTLLLGEYSMRELETSPLFSIVDGLITLSQREAAREQQRFLHVVKMRGTEHLREPAPFAIRRDGIRVLVPSAAPAEAASSAAAAAARATTGIARLDRLVHDGIPAGSSILVAGAAGTGKTVLLLESVYRSALAGRKAILFTFEETPARLCATARNLGWDVDAPMRTGLLEVVGTKPSDIRVEEQLASMHQRVVGGHATCVAIDSLSVLLGNISDPQTVREKVSQLCAMVQDAGAIGFFATDSPAAECGQITRHGVEASVADGVILLTLVERGLNRHRFVEIYKLRNADHLTGRHAMTIGKGGITVYPRYGDEESFMPPRAFDVTRRMPTGNDELDELLGGGGVLERSVTLVSGSTGSGKSTLAIQFVLAGARASEPCLYIAREEGPQQIVASATALGLPLAEAVEAGTVELLYLTGEDIRAAQLLTLLTDKIQARGVRRLVIDSATRLESDDFEPTELPRLLSALVVRFKALGVTSLFTVEAKRLYAGPTLDEQGLSPIADNVILLRYASGEGGTCVHTLEPLKTRGSDHLTGTYPFRIGKGGVHIDARRRSSS